MAFSADACTAGLSWVSAWLALLRYDVAVQLRRNAQSGHATHKDGRNKRVHLVFFTCQKHYRYLEASLASLAQFPLNKVGNIYVYIDRYNSLVPAQQKVLATSFPFTPILRSTPYRMSWGGPNVLVNELSAFREIQREVDPGDYVGKIDSDVLFISDNIFSEVLESQVDLLGQVENYHAPFVFMQGACYFLKVDFIAQLCRLRLSSVVREVLQKLASKETISIGDCPEDAVLYQLAGYVTSSIRLIDFFLPLDRIGECFASRNNNYSVIHFEFSLVEKDEMLAARMKSIAQHKALSEPGHGLSR